MTTHKHAEMIKAKADNMDLVVLRKHYEGEWVELADQGEIRIKQNGEYLLCLPRHKEACLHWLNGGEIQFKNNGLMYFEDIDYGYTGNWSLSRFFMDEKCQVRIKPRKEKRWVGFSPKSNIVTGVSFNTKESLTEYVNQNFAYPEYVQAIEIEVEI